MYYPGEQYAYGSVVGGPQPGASLTMTTTGISATAVAGSTYTATIQYANVSWSNCNVNPSANVALNILANGVVVSSGHLVGAGSRFAVDSGDCGLGGHGCLRRPSDPAPGGGDELPRRTGSYATVAGAYFWLRQRHSDGHGASWRSGRSQRSDGNGRLFEPDQPGWTNNSNNETGFKIDQATSSDFTQA